MAGIAPENQYVFALTKGSLSQTRGHDVLRNFADSCGADHPENMRSLNHRKHVATMSQLINLKCNERLYQLREFRMLMVLAQMKSSPVLHLPLEVGNHAQVNGVNVAAGALKSDITDQPFYRQLSYPELLTSV